MKIGLECFAINYFISGLLISERSCTTSLKKRIEKLIVQEDQRTYDLIKLVESPSRYDSL